MLEVLCDIAAEPDTSATGISTTVAVLNHPTLPATIQLLFYWTYYVTEIQMFRIVIELSVFVLV